MAKGNRIIVTPDPRGQFERITVSGTPKPGTCMEFKPGTTMQNGRYTYEAYGTTAASGSHGVSASGDRTGVCVLLCFADNAECPPGKGPTDAYVSGDNGCVYWPLPGENLNVLFKDTAGTADDIAVDDKMIIDDGSGKVLKSTGSVESEPFNAREALVDPVADQLLWCVFTGQ